MCLGLSGTHEVAPGGSHTYDLVTTWYAVVTEPSGGIC